MSKDDEELRYMLAVLCYSLKTFRKMSGTWYSHGELGILLGDIVTIATAVEYLDGTVSKDPEAFAIEASNSTKASITFKVPELDWFGTVIINITLVDDKEKYYRMEVV